MPTRKQRRRREKNFRHEYETVLLDADGTEHPLDEEEVKADREARAQAKAETKPAARKNGAQPQRRGRGMREVAPPSWDRALRRGGVMGGIMLIAFVFLFKNAPMGMRLAWGAFYAVAFIPLTYWVDRTAYRAYQRRLAKQSQSQSQPQKK